MMEPVGHTPEPDKRLREFEARIACGEKIEPGDWVPEEYRRPLIRMNSQHAHSEIIDMLPEEAWITRAATLRRKLILLTKVQDEAGYGQFLYDAAESLGVTRGGMVAEPDGVWAPRPGLAQHSSPGEVGHQDQNQR